MFVYQGGAGHGFAGDEDDAIQGVIGGGEKHAWCCEFPFSLGHRDGLVWERRVRWPSRHLSPLTLDAEAFSFGVPDAKVGVE